MLVRSDREGTWGIYLVPLDDRRVDALVTGLHELSDAAPVSPDHKWILYSERVQSNPGASYRLMRFALAAVRQKLSSKVPLPISHAHKWLERPVCYSGAKFLITDKSSSPLWIMLEDEPPNSPDFVTSTRGTVGIFSHAQGSGKEAVRVRLHDGISAFTVLLATENEVAGSFKGFPAASSTRP